MTARAKIITIIVIILASTGLIFFIIKKLSAKTYSFDWAGGQLVNGQYFAGLLLLDAAKHTMKVGDSVKVTWSDGSSTSQKIIMLGSDDGRLDKYGMIVVDRRMDDLAARGAGTIST